MREGFVLFALDEFVICSGVGVIGGGSNGDDFSLITLSRYPSPISSGCDVVMGEDFDVPSIFDNSSRMPLNFDKAGSLTHSGSFPS